MHDKETLHTVLTQQQIASRVAALGKEIEAWRKGEPLVAICVLKGAFIFFADLVRHLKRPLTLDFMRAESYGDDNISCGEVRIRLQPSCPLKGQRVLLVEDIVDTGLSMKVLHDAIMLQEPKELAVCTLLSKHERRAVDVQVDFSGFEIADGFLVGYGLDHAERFRELPEIMELRFHDPAAAE